MDTSDNCVPIPSNRIPDSFFGILLAGLGTSPTEGAATRPCAPVAALFVRSGSRGSNDPEEEPRISSQNAPL